jgi:hypothetical protein
MMPDMAERINTALIAALPVSCYYKYIATRLMAAQGLLLTFFFKLLSSVLYTGYITPLKCK